VTRPGELAGSACELEGGRAGADGALLEAGHPSVSEYCSRRYRCHALAGIVRGRGWVYKQVST